MLLEPMMPIFAPFNRRADFVPIMDSRRAVVDSSGRDESFSKSRPNSE